MLCVVCFFYFAFTEHFMFTKPAGRGTVLFLGFFVIIDYFLLILPENCKQCNKEIIKILQLYNRSLNNWNLIVHIVTFKLKQKTSIIIKFWRFRYDLLYLFVLIAVIFFYSNYSIFGLSFIKVSTLGIFKLN